MKHYLRLTLLTHYLPGCQGNAGQSQRAGQRPLLLRLHRERDGELQGRPANQTAYNDQTPEHSLHTELSILSFLLSLVLLTCSLRFVQVLGESMAGISQNCKTGDVPAFGDCVGSASKALCGLTEAAGQVQNVEKQLSQYRSY